MSSSIKLKYIKDLILEEIFRIKINEAYIDKDGKLIDMDFASDNKLGNGNGNGNGNVDFKSFPPSVLKTLENEYFGYDNNFDWNKKQDEFRNNPEGFNEFRKRNKSEQFKKSIGKLITYTIQDMILKRKQYIAKKKLHDFEQLIIPAFGNDILCQRLSKYEEEVLMNPDATIEDLERGFREAKQIVDRYGEIDYSKLEKGSLKVDDQINLANFERYVGKHPEYRPAYEQWKKLMEEESEISFKPTHAYRETTSYEKIKELRDFLIDYRKKM